MSRGLNKYVVLAVVVLLGLCLSTYTLTPVTTSSAGVETISPEDTVPGAALEDLRLPDAVQAAEPFASAETQEGIDGLSAGTALAGRERVDDGFFSDAAFFGNSLMEGLGSYGGLESGSFFAHARIALFNLDTEYSTVLDNGDTGTLYQAMTQRQYEKIYVLLGVNEIGWDASYFASRYETFLERLQQDEPEADIYIMSLSPVTRETSDTHEYFNMERVRAYNEELLALAEKTGCWYLDLCQALGGEDGFLPPERAADDGIHFTQDTYFLLADYLRTHYAGAPASDIGT